jgi:hypothetical protein
MGDVAASRIDTGSDESEPSVEVDPHPATASATIGRMANARVERFTGISLRGRVVPE